MKKLNLAYFGSPDFAADFLEKLVTDKSINRIIEVKLVVTQEDKPVGRKQTLTATPVKEIAKKYGLECVEIENCLPIGKAGKMKIEKLDLALVYAYGELIPKAILSLPKYGFWNIHPSLLPKYRGSSPIATPLMNGDKTTGVTIIKMDEKIDHGPIIAQESYPILNTDYRIDLEKKLTDLAFKMFKKIIEGESTKFFATWGPGKPFIAQNHQEATYTHRLSKDDGYIEFKNLTPTLSGENSPEKLFNLFRGLYPWPGIWTSVKINSVKKRLKITEMGMINGKLVIKCVQLEGKNEVDFETFNKAYKIF